MPRRAGVEALGLALVPFVSLGLARFAYGLLLPAMRADLGWTYAEAGLVTTANAVGYLIGAAGAPRVIRRLDARGAVLWGLWGTALSLLVNGATSSFSVILLARAAAGILGGIAFVAGGVLAAGLSARGLRSALAIYPAGAGAAVALTAVTIPSFIDRTFLWPRGWFLLSALTAAAALTALKLVPREPGHSPDPIAPLRDKSIRLRKAELAYGLFGLGYIGYVTFAVAFLNDLGVSSASVSTFWLLLGVTSVLSTAASSRLISTGRGEAALAATTAICAVAVLVLVLGRTTLAALISAVLFGGSFLAVVTAMTQLVRDGLEAHSWPAAIGRLTVFFGVGQILGPILAGIIGDTAAGLRLGLTASAVVLVCSALVSWTARARR